MAYSTRMWQAFGRSAMFVRIRGHLARYFSSVAFSPIGFSDVVYNVDAEPATVAKFLLGAANRMPEDAQRHFRGHAVLVIGAELGPEWIVTAKPPDTTREVRVDPLR